MKWIILLWTSFVSVLIAIYADAWRDMLSIPPPKAVLFEGREGCRS